MSNVAISKKSIIDAAVVIANELQVAANNATQTYNNHYQNGTHTKADKANMLAATTKLAYFTNNVLNAVNDEKLAGVFYYAIKASKQAPEAFFREAMTNSYSLENWFIWLNLSSLVNAFIPSLICPDLAYSH